MVTVDILLPRCCNVFVCAPHTRLSSEMSSALEALRAQVRIRWSAQDYPAVRRLIEHWLGLTGSLALALHAPECRDGVDEGLGQHVPDFLLVAALRDDDREGLMQPLAIALSETTRISL